VGSTYIPHRKATRVVAAVVLDVPGDMEVNPPGVWITSQAGTLPIPNTRYSVQANEEKKNTGLPKMIKARME